MSTFTPEIEHPDADPRYAALHDMMSLVEGGEVDQVCALGVGDKGFFLLNGGGDLTLLRDQLSAFLAES